MILSVMCPLFALQLIRNRRHCSNDGAYLQFIWLIYPFINIKSCKNLELRDFLLY